jgi:gamma-glutamyltranspeptidase / glutathione hydrolase
MADCLRLFTALVAVFLLFAYPVVALAEDAGRPPAAAIASAHPLATDAGLEILGMGGNAFDAAVAVTAALAVVEPSGSGLGGGGFWLLYRADDGFEVMVDGRERAPLAAHADMYLDGDREPVRERSLNGPLAAAIPGTPAGIVHLAQRYGTLPLRDSLAPAIRLARDGFPVDAHYRNMARFRLETLQASPAAAAIFLDEGELPDEGFLIRQPDLANALDLIARFGHVGFYAGDVAQRLIEGVTAAGGIWSNRDLADYRIVERPVVRGEYRGIRISAASPPSSGGIALVTMLNILSGYDLDRLEPAARRHLVIEAMRRAYRDRADYLGDPDFVGIPAMLTDPHYAAGLRNTIRPDRATPSASLPGAPVEPEGSDTTHFSILDRDGNRVAATLSINWPFGAGFVPPGTGILLNNEMDDFAVKPAAPNVYGLIGTEAGANAIAPGKRPLSSMTPVFLDDGARVAILGTPGGSRIITMVLLATLAYADGKPVEEWIGRGRYHHQFLPDNVTHEPDAFDETEIAALEGYGHELRALNRRYGNMQAILWNRAANSVEAASDPRGIGKAALHP